MHGNFEGQLAAVRVREQQDTKELRKVTEDRDAMVARLEKQMTHIKKLAIEEFKSSNDFQEAVELTGSKYFVEGFNFCKRQIAHHYPNLGIDIQGMGIDANLLKEEEKVEEEEEEEKEKEEQQEK